jgi:hypothetical protein
MGRLFGVSLLPFRLLPVVLNALALPLRQILRNLLEHRFKLERAVDVACCQPDFHDPDYCNFHCVPSEELFSIACTLPVCRQFEGNWAHLLIDGLCYFYELTDKSKITPNVNHC